MKNFYVYMDDFVRKRRASGNLEGEDMLSVLLRAEEEGDRLNSSELTGSMIALVQASHETTANMITNAAYQLFANSTLMTELREDPSLIPAAVNEFLRFESSSHALLPRAALENIEIAGVTIAQGERVSLLTAAANRDPAVFADPDKIDFHRPPSERHVAFGGGPHSCLGQNLARIEVTAILEVVVERMSHLELKEQPRFAAGRPRGLESLWVGPGSIRFPN